MPKARPRTPAPVLDPETGGKKSDFTASARHVFCSTRPVVARDKGESASLLIFSRVSHTLFSALTLLRSEIVVSNSSPSEGSPRLARTEEAVTIMPEIISRILHRIHAWRHGSTGPSHDRVSRVFKFKYACFKDLLASNTELLNIITDLEQKLRGQEVFGMSYVRSQATRAVFHTLRMVKSLDDLSGHRYPMLFDTLEKINLAVKEELGKKKELPVSAWVLPYSEITKEMVDWVGGKNANLGEMRNRAKLPVPEGFAITTRAFNYLLEYNELSEEIARNRMDLDPNDPQAVNTVSENIQRLIMLARVPEDLEKAIYSAYDAMTATIREQSDHAAVYPRVALRSSAIGEDSELSYAGQYVSLLNVPREKIVETYKYVVASLYTPRAIAYRLNKGMRDEDIAMSVACIEMVESVASGVMYSRHPFNVWDDHVLVTAVWGLGPYAVEGVITPDSYTVSKDGEQRILETSIARKPVQLIAVPAGGLQEVAVDPEKQDAACISPEQVRNPCPPRGGTGNPLWSAAGHRMGSG